MRRSSAFSTRRRSGIMLVGLLLVPLVMAAPATAQEDPDFLFGRPDLTLGFSGGWFIPRAGSDIFDVTTDHLFVETSDFQSPLIRGELGIRATERLDVTLGVGYARSETTSEYRDYIGVDDLPIVQTVSLSTIPITLTVKGYLRDRGRSVSRFAWIPAAWSPWVGGGVGLVRYHFQREGEFVSEETLDIFRDDLVSEGTEPLFHVASGGEVTLTPRLVLTGDVRYQWASGEMGGDYQGYEIDLGGFQASAGLSVRF